MKTSRGFSLLPIPLTLASAAAGLALGIGGYAFYYAKGSSYMGNDPATCANCHVMSAYYAGWLAPLARLHAGRLPGRHPGPA